MRKRRTVIVRNRIIRVIRQNTSECLVQSFFLDMVLTVVSAVWKLTINGYLNLADTDVWFCVEGALGCGKLGVIDVQPLE